MPDFTNISGAAVDVYASSGYESLHVEPDQVITVPGELAEDQPADAYVVGTGDNARAWPHSRWQLKEAPKVPKGKPAPSDTATAGKESA